MTKPAANPSADEMALICSKCKVPGTIRITDSRGSTLPLVVTCSKILGGCGRWFSCGSRLIEDGGEV